MEYNREDGGSLCDEGKQDIANETHNEQDYGWSVQYEPESGMNIKGRKDPVIFSEKVGISNPFVRKALELGVEIHFHFSYIFFDLNNFIFK